MLLLVAICRCWRGVAILLFDHVLALIHSLVPFVLHLLAVALLVFVAVLFLRLLLPLSSSLSSHSRSCSCWLGAVGVSAVS